jgi:hypothetical protein
MKSNESPNNDLLQKDIDNKINEVMYICNMISQLDKIIKKFKEKSSDINNQENDQLILEYLNERKVQVQMLQNILFPNI